MKFVSRNSVFGRKSWQRTLGRFVAGLALFFVVAGFQQNLLAKNLGEAKAIGRLLYYGLGPDEYTITVTQLGTGMSELTLNPRIYTEIRHAGIKKITVVKNKDIDLIALFKIKGHSVSAALGGAEVASDQFPITGPKSVIGDIIIYVGDDDDPNHWRKFEGKLEVED